MASEWFYTRDGKGKTGPVSSAQLQALAKSGKLQPTDMVWKEGMAKWTQASKIKGLFSSNAEAVTASKPSAAASTGHSGAAAKTRKSKPSAEESEEPAGSGRSAIALVAVAAVICIGCLGGIIGGAAFFLNSNSQEKALAENKEKKPGGQVGEEKKPIPATQPEEKELPKEQPESGGADKKNPPPEPVKDKEADKKELPQPPKDIPPEKKELPQEQVKDKQPSKEFLAEKLTGEYLPLRPGTRAIFKVASFLQSKEQNSFFDYEHTTGGKILLNKLSSSGPPDTPESLKKDKTIFTYEYRIKDATVDLGLVLPKRPIWWQPKIKCDSSLGTSWERQMPSDGFPGTTTYRHTLLRFEPLKTDNQTFLCAILMEETISEIAPASTAFREALSVDYVAFAKGIGMVRKDVYKNDAKGKAFLSQRWTLMDAQLSQSLAAFHLPIASERQFVKSSRQIDSKPVGPSVCSFCDGNGRCFQCKGSGLWKGDAVGPLRKCPGCNLSSRPGVCTPCEGTGVRK